MYTTINFKTKKDLKTAVAENKEVGIYAPGIGAGSEPKNGTIAVEGPWYPKPHSWYAQVTLENGVIKKVK